MTTSGSSPGDTRSALLAELLQRKTSGLTIDELSGRLGITRTAVQQHITTLERDGLVSVKGQRSTGGRPSRTYGLTEAGFESFPRKYAMLAESLLETATKSLGEEATERLLAEMADDLAARLKSDLDKVPAEKRLPAVVEVMNELGYQAAPLPSGEGIAATNCIYHKLAKCTRAVCRYDVRLLTRLLDRPLEHVECMADGEERCVFTTATS